MFSKAPTKCIQMRKSIRVEKPPKIKRLITDNANKPADAYEDYKAHLSVIQTKPRIHYSNQVNLMQTTARMVLVYSPYSSIHSFCIIPPFYCLNESEQEGAKETQSGRPSNLHNLFDSLMLAQKLLDGTKSKLTCVFTNIYKWHANADELECYSDKLFLSASVFYVAVDLHLVQSKVLRSFCHFSFMLPFERFAASAPLSIYSLHEALDISFSY